MRSRHYFSKFLDIKERTKNWSPNAPPPNISLLFSIWATFASPCAMCQPLESWRSEFWSVRTLKKWTSQERQVSDQEFGSQHFREMSRERKREAFGWLLEMSWDEFRQGMIKKSQSSFSGPFGFTTTVAPLFFGIQDFSIANFLCQPKERSRGKRGKVELSILSAKLKVLLTSAKQSTWACAGREGDGAGQGALLSYYKIFKSQILQI